MLTSVDDLRIKQVNVGQRRRISKYLRKTKNKQNKNTTTTTTLKNDESENIISSHFFLNSIIIIAMQFFGFVEGYFYKNKRKLVCIEAEVGIGLAG